ncbi:MAG: GtrA family protein [Anaerolineae bacterium]
MDNTTKAQRFRNPLDTPILYIANRYGGNKPKELERFLKFAFVGVSGAIVDFGILFLMQETLFKPTSTFNVAAATAIAFTTAVISNFIWTRLWVYPESREQPFRRQLAQFAFISITGGVARTVWIAASYKTIGHLFMPAALPLIHILNPGYPGSLETEWQVGTVVAQLIGMVVVMLWNFFANRYWTYGHIE